MLQKLLFRSHSVLFLGLLLAGLTSSAKAIVITGETATASSVNAFVPTTPIRAVDDSGLVAGQHARANPTYDNAWLSKTTNQGGDPDPWFLVDLGAVYNITSFHVWNYNEGGGNSSHGITSADITYSTSNSSGTGSTLGTYPFGLAPGDPSYTGEDFTATFTARYIRFDNLGSYDTVFATGNVAYGLSEVQFTGELAPPVPEPSSVALLGLGVVLIGACHKKRRSS